MLTGDGSSYDTATGSGDSPRRAAHLFADSVAETLGLRPKVAQTYKNGVEVWAIGAFGLAGCCADVKSWLQGALTLQQNGKSRSTDEMAKQVCGLEKQVAAAQLRAAQAENHRQKAVDALDAKTVRFNELQRKVHDFLDFETRYKALGLRLGLGLGLV
jgi:Fe-S-cluster formation regulator IscX/YfhJ